MLKFGLLLLLVTVCLSVDAAPSTSPSVKPPKGCKFTDDSHKELSCLITKLSDCNNLLNTPYARNLFCPSAYGAAYTMRKALVQTLGPRAKTTGAFIYYQTLPDVGLVPAGDESQTIDPCMDAPAPWNTSNTIGVGLPLCGLIARAASFNFRPPAKYNDAGNPVTSTNHYTNYFKNLIFPTTTSVNSSIINFREGSPWDKVIEKLGATSAKLFSAMQPDFLNGTGAPYNPWNLTTNSYHGITGGGGSGWGTEIGIGKAILLEFGGGGGSGVTSYTGTDASITSRVGAGGGGGVNFGNDYYDRNGQSCDGLGLGAGGDYETGKVVYTHYAAGDSGNGQVTYNATIVGQYISEMKNLRARLQGECAAGKSILFRGGGGAGAGAEFFKMSGDQYEPQAISTQGGFSFTYSITCNKQRAAPEPIPAGLYAELGKIYNKANNDARMKCGGWSDYSCVCRTSNSYVVAFVKKKYKVVPDWLKSSTCPSNQPSSPSPAPAPVV
jgi:hypothetical protein